MSAQRGKIAVGVPRGTEKHLLDAALCMYRGISCQQLFRSEGRLLSMATILVPDGAEDYWVALLPSKVDLVQCAWLIAGQQIAESEFPPHPALGLRKQQT